MAIKNEKATVDVYINGKQATQELANLKQQFAILEQSKNDMAKAGQEMSKDQLKLYKETEAELKKYDKAVENITVTLNNLSGKSYRDLQEAARRLQIEINKQARGTEEENRQWKHNVEMLGLVKAEITKVKGEMNTLGTETKKTGGLFNSFKEMVNFGQNFTFGNVMYQSLIMLKDGFMNLFSGSMKEWNEAAKGIAQLDAVIKSTGGAAGKTSQQIDEMANSLAGLTSFEDDAIKQSSALLLTFTQISGGTFDKAQMAILDMATAMATASGTEVDLKDTTIKVGKALNDPIQGMTALKKAGVMFTESQKEQIKVLQEAGDLVGAQNIILQELQKEFGGSAEAARAADVSFNEVSKSWKNLQEDIGEKGAGAFKSLANAIRGSIEFVREHLGVFSGMVKVVGSAGVGLLTYIGVVKAATLAKKIYTSVTTAFTVATEGATIATRVFNAVSKMNPIGLIAGVISTAITAFLMFRDSVKESNKALEEANRLTDEFKKKTGEEAGRMNLLFEGLKNSNVPLREKQKLVKDLNGEYGKYLPFLVDETMSIKDIISVQKLANIELEKQISLKLANEKAAKFGERKAELESQIMGWKVYTSVIQQSWDVRKKAEDEAKKTGKDVDAASRKAFNDYVKNSALAKKIGDEYGFDMLTTTGKFNKQILELQTQLTTIDMMITSNSNSYNKILSGIEQKEANSLETKEAILAKQKELNAMKNEELEDLQKEEGVSKKEKDMAKEILAERKKNEKMNEVRIKEKTKYEEWNRKLKEIDDLRLDTTLSAIEKEVEAVRKKYDDMIAAGKKFLAESPGLAPEKKEKVEGDIKNLEVERDAAIKARLLEHEEKLMTDVMAVREKFVEHKKSLSNKEIEIIDNEVDKLLKQYDETEAKINEFFQAKLKMAETGSEEYYNIIDEWETAIGMNERNRTDETADYKLEKEQEFHDKIKGLLDEGSFVKMDKDQEEITRIEAKYKKLIEEAIRYYDAEIALAGENEEKKRSLTEEKEKTVGTLGKNKELAKAEKTAEKERQTRVQLSQFAIQETQLVSDTMFKIESDRLSAETNQKMSELNNRKAKELSQANLTEEQKAQIERKYAAEAAVIKQHEWQASQEASKTQAIVNGALAVTNILATMPWVTFGIAQGIAIASAVASTAAQVAIISSQKMPQFAKGKYPVVGADDGKVYDAGFGGRATTGFVHSPTLFLAGEQPEMIIDNPTLRIPMVQKMAKIIYDIKHGGVRQFAEGNYPELGIDKLGIRNGDSSQAAINAMMLKALEDINRKMDNPTRAMVSYDDLRDSQARVDGIINESNLG